MQKYSPVCLLNNKLFIYVFIDTNSLKQLYTILDYF